MRGRIALRKHFVRNATKRRYVLSRRRGTLGVRARPRAAFGPLTPAPARHSEIVGHADRVDLE